MHKHSPSRYAYWSAPLNNRTMFNANILRMEKYFREFTDRTDDRFHDEIDTLKKIMSKVVETEEGSFSDISQIRDIVLNNLFSVLKHKSSTDETYVAFKSLVRVIDNIFRNNLDQPIPDMMFVVAGHRRAPSPPRRSPSPPRRAPSPPRRSPSPPRRSPSPPRTSASTDCRTLLRENNINSKDDYKRFVLTHHPDKLVQAGASPRRIQRSEALFKRIVPCADEARRTYWW